jgi:dienelactone hydrolase
MFILLVVALMGARLAPEPIMVTSANGMRMAAEWRDSGVSNGPVAVFFPMCDSRPKATWQPVAELLQQRGVSSLVMSYPGRPGNSPFPGPQPPPDPQTVYWNAQFAQVVEAAVGAAHARSSGTIVTAGASCGVDRALEAARRFPDNVTGVVAVAGDYSPEELAFVRERHLPVLAMTARSDSPGPAVHEALAAASGHAATRLRIIDGSGHGTDLFERQPELAVDIATWIHDRAARQPGP